MLVLVGRLVDSIPEGVLITIGTLHYYGYSNNATDRPRRVGLVQPLSQMSWHQNLT